MNIRDAGEEWEAEWDAFCSQSPDAWFRHTQAWTAYNCAYRPSWNPESKSFVVTNNGEILAACPLVLEERDGVREFTFGGGYGPAPAFAESLTSKQRKRLMKQTFAEIDRRADRHDVKRVKLKLPTLATPDLDDPRWNHLVRFGYSDTSINTRIIDLTKSLEALRGEMRKGHRHAIRDGTEQLETVVFDDSSITSEIFEAYKQMHHRDAGGQHRPDETFEMMNDWIRNGQAFLVGAKRDGDWVGFSLFERYGDCAYYGSSARDPDSDYYDLPIGHVIQWRALEWLKAQGLTRYEVGYQHFKPVMPEVASEKQVNISYFKRGFGGETVPLYRGEKFYDAAYFREVYEERLGEYEAVLESDD